MLGNSTTCSKHGPNQDGRVLFFWIWTPRWRKGVPLGGPFKPEKRGHQLQKDEPPIRLPFAMSLVASQGWQFTNLQLFRSWRLVLHGETAAFVQPLLEAPTEMQVGFRVLGYQHLGMSVVELARFGACQFFWPPPQEKKGRKKTEKDLGSPWKVQIQKGGGTQCWSSRCPVLSPGPRGSTASH